MTVRLSDHKEVGSEVQHLKSEAAEQSSHLSGLKSQVAGRKAELASLDAQRAKRSKEMAEKEERLETNLRRKMERARVKAQELEMLSKLKAEPSKHGLDLETLLSLAKEFQHGQ